MQVQLLLQGKGFVLSSVRQTNNSWFLLVRSEGLGVQLEEVVPILGPLPPVLLALPQTQSSGEGSGPGGGRDVALRMVPR